MSHRDNFIKTNKEFSKPLDIFNIGFMGALGAPPDVPSAPTVSNSDGTITISWSAPDAHGNAIDVYNVYRNGTYLKQVSTTSTTDTTGTLGTSYVYAIDAHNVIDWSGVSPNSSSVIPAQVPSTPTAPTASRSTSTVTITWSAPSANGSAITSYVITINGSSSNVGNVTSYAHTNGTLGTAYVYTISAINATGTSSASGNSNSVTPSTVPNAPTIGTATDDTSNLTVTANWSAAAANGNAVTAYKVYANGGHIATLGNVTTYVYTATKNATYYFAVSATNTNGYGATSGNSNTVTNTSPSTVRGVWMGGAPPAATASGMDWITIATTGNATTFGALSLDTHSTYSSAGLHSNTRGVLGGGTIGAVGGKTNRMQYITIANTGNSTDFGDLSNATNYLGATNTTTKGVFTGGTGETDLMEYITIASTGNATDFGTLSLGRSYCVGIHSTTRGVFGGGVGGSGAAAHRVMDYITIATNGNAISFGNLSHDSRYNIAPCNTTVRGVFASSTSAPKTVMDYVTIATTGNATDFGDLSLARNNLAGMHNETRGVFGGGSSASASADDTMDWITIATTGNATDFGNLSMGRKYLAAVNGG